MRGYLPASPSCNKGVPALCFALGKLTSPCTLHVKCLLILSSPRYRDSRSSGMDCVSTEDRREAEINIKWYFTNSPRPWDHALTSSVSLHKSPRGSMLYCPNVRSSRPIGKTLATPIQHHAALCATFCSVVFV